MNTNRQVVLVLPPSDVCGTPDALLHAAASLAQGAPLTVLALASANSAAVPARAIAAPAQWWQCHHPLLERLDAANLLPCMKEALQLNSTPSSCVILLPPGPLTEECAALLAAELDGEHLGRCTTIALEDGDVLAERHAFGGRLAWEMRSASKLCTATWRPARQAVSADGEALNMPQQHIATLITSLPAAVHVALLESTDKLPPLENAKLIVSGGRGMQGETGFGLLTDIALQLNASLGGSLPTVDAGWVPVSRQIGQSGKFVNPKIYFTVGISGTPQHLAGVSPDSRIIAINKDPQAPIFNRAQVGLVGEWQTLLPALLHELRTASA